MSDEDDPIRGAEAAPHPFAMPYDFLKHLTTLSVISIGGVFGLLQADGITVSPRAILIVLATLGTAGGIALIANALIVGRSIGDGAALARLTRSVRIAQFAAMALYIFGIGIFVGAFSKALGV